MALLMNSVNKVPIPSIQTQIPIYINKVISVEKICFRFLNYMDDYVRLLGDMKRYYDKKPNPSLISNLSENEAAIKQSLFILKRDNVYYRVKVKDIWAINSFLVELLDEGFDYLANEKELFLNDNPEFANKPSQGFVYSLDFNRDYDKKMNYVINYGLQKLVFTKENFFVNLSGNGGITLFYKDKNLVNINEFLLDYLKATERTGEVENAVDAHLNSLGSNSQESNSNATKSNAQVIYYSSEPTLSGSVPRFQVPDGELKMKCKHVFNPSDFYLKLKKSTDFINFTNELNAFYAKNSPKNATSVVVNNLYITNYKDKWIRMLILGTVSRDENAKFYSCLLFDKGIVGTICDEDIYDLDERFKTKPPRSVKASLAFVKPSTEKWTKEANEFFKNYVKGCQLDVFKIDHEDAIFYCSLIKGNENVSEILNSRGFAVIDF